MLATFQTTTKGKAKAKPSTMKPDPKKTTATAKVPEWRVPVDVAYPDEFIDTFISTCFHTVDRYLELSHAPKEIRDLLDIAQSIQINLSTVENGKIRHGYNEAIKDYIAEASQLIATVGGEFTDHDGSTRPRENSILAKLEGKA